LVRAKDPSTIPELSILKEVFLVQDSRPLYHFAEISDKVIVDNENGTVGVGTQQSIISNEYEQATTVTGEEEEEGDTMLGEDETYNNSNGE